EIAGNIFAPGEFVTKRPKAASDLALVTHVVVDYDALSIELVANEEDHFAKIVKGKMDFTPEFLEFSINRKTNFSVDGLYKMLRLKRAYFATREEHAAILEQLKKFQAKTEVEFQSMNDYKGSTAMQKVQTCKTNLQYNFVLSLSIYKGTDPVTFPVEVEFEPTDGSIRCWLVSEDLAELEIKIRDEIMKGELDKFAPFVIVQR
ncbi:MAG: hypothetical protein JWP27_1454, partial [Flaviaesturariibacter sp.]|nr:hypothetical protein [Flaviaesturariibacter sp.]